jgi:hypothetical protein
MLGGWVVVVILVMVIVGIFSRTHGESYNPQYSTTRNANRTTTKSRHHNSSGGGGGGGRYNNDDRVFQQFVQHQRDHMMRR